MRRGEVVVEGPKGRTYFELWAVVSTPPCCEYEGSGRACGDAVCLEYVELAQAETSGQMGAGTLAKMPGLPFPFHLTSDSSAE